MIGSQFPEVLFRDFAQQLPAAPRLLVELGRIIRQPHENSAAAAAQDRYHGLPGEEPDRRVTAESFRRAGLDERVYPHACERAQRTFDRLHAAVI